MIELINISKEYNHSKSNSLKALTDINLFFPETGMVSIIGKSGSGKSTLLNILSGLISFSDGKYILDGVDVTNFDSDQWNQIRNKYFGYIFQANNLIEYLTVEENLRLIQMILPENDNFESELSSILEKLDIQYIRYKKISEISGGEQQRVALARALLKKSRIILADEPTGSLDYENAINVFNILKKISSEMLVIVVTHDNEFADLYSDYTVKLSYGKILSNSLPVIESNNYTTQMKFERINIKFRDLIKVSLNINKSQKFRYFFMSIFVLITLSIVLMATTFSFFNQGKFVYDAINGSEISNIFISEYPTDLIFSDNTSDLDTSLFPSIQFDKTYSNQINVTTKSLFNTQLSYQLFRTIILSEDLLDNEIIITDYQADLMKDSGVFSFTNYNELINNQISIGNFSIKILDVIITNYSVDVSNQYQFRLVNTYDVIKMNLNTFTLIIEYLNYGVVVVDDFGDINLGIVDQLSTLDENSYSGDLDILTEEIVVSVVMLQYLTGEVFNNPDDIENYLNTSFNITFSFNGVIHTNEYTIKAVTYEELRKIYFNRVTYESEINQYQFIIEDLEYTYEVSNYDFDDFLALYEFISSNNLSLNSYVSRDTNTVINFISSLRIILLVFSMAAVGLLLITLYFFIKSSISQNLFNIGILKSIGFLNIHINIIFNFINFIIIIFSYVISSLVHILFMNLFNIYFKSELIIDINVFNFDLIYYLYLLFLIIVFSVVISFFAMSKIKKIEIMRLIK